MELIVDLHVHSHYSRATSRNCTLEGLYTWGKRKGINVIGTGDFTHPGWFAEIRDKLVPTAGGLYKLRKDIADELDASLPVSVRGNLLLFVPSAEIATIYKKGGRGRRLHQLVIMPSLKAAARLSARLEQIGNLQADGRPMLGLDSKELLRFALEADKDALYVPAHIWTPWFGLFGSKSGFDSIAEAYDDLAPEVRAIETGLGSDPAINWRLKQLDGLAITSNSDAHSPQKLGREATLIHAQSTYADIVGGIKANDARLAGTIEFFPQEGKYYYDGHRACGVRFSPAETRSHDGMCPVCGRRLTVGVEYRVDTLADRALAEKKPDKTVEYIVPLTEVLTELRGTKSASGRGITVEYEALIAQFGDEFSILRHVPLEAIRGYSPPLAVAVERIRTGKVYRSPGYDGVFGTISVFKDAAERIAVRSATFPETRRRA